MTEEQARHVCETMQMACEANNEMMVNKGELGEAAAALRTDIQGAHNQVSLMDVRRSASRDTEMAQIRTDLEQKMNQVVRAILGLAGTAVALFLGWKRLDDIHARQRALEQRQEAQMSAGWGARL